MENGRFTPEEEAYLVGLDAVDAVDDGAVIRWNARFREVIWTPWSSRLKKLQELPKEGGDHGEQEAHRGGAPGSEPPSCAPITSAPGAPPPRGRLARIHPPPARVNTPARTP